MEWKICPLWPRYLISSTGEIMNIKTGLKRKPYLTISGYFYIVVRDRDRKMACAIHRLVAQAFIGEAPDGKPFVAHYDGDKTNNNVENLRWASRSENEADKVRHGKSNRGERFGRSRLTKENVIIIKNLISEGCTAKNIAKMFDVAVTTIK